MEARQMVEENNNYPPMENDQSANAHSIEKMEELDQENQQIEIDKTMRAGFIVKVYGIVAFQLTISILFIACAFIPGYQSFLQSKVGMVLVCIASISCIAIAIALTCFTVIGRRVPLNYILLITFTILESYCLQFICSIYDYQSILIAGGLTIGTVVSLALYALKTKTDYSWKGAFLFNCLILFIISGIFLMFFWKVYLLQTLYSILGVLLFSVYLIYDIQLISGKFGVSFTIDDYIIAAMNIYLDIINLFLKLLEIFGSSRR